MKWLKALFQNSDKDLQDCDIVLTSPPVIREVNIGEPVFSFVSCVKANPKRFTFIKVKDDRPVYAAGSTYDVKDKHTGEEWRIRTDWRCNRKFICLSLEWLTDDETAYLFSEIQSFYHTRITRLNEIRTKRFKRTQVGERNRLMGVYCK